MAFDVEVGEQAVALEHHAHVALVGRRAEHVAAVDEHRPRVGALEPGGDAQRGRLAAPRRAEQADQLARLHRQVERLERDGSAERLADRLVAEREATVRSLQAERRRRRRGRRVDERDDREQRRRDDEDDEAEARRRAGTRRSRARR